MFTKHERPVNVAEQFALLEAERRNRKPELTMSHRWAVASIVLSVLIMSFPFLFPVVPIVIFLGLWLAQIPLRGLRVLHLDWGMLLILSLPLLCAISSLWSDYPTLSLYLGTAFVALNICVLICSRIVRFPSLMDGITIGLCIVLVIAFILGSRPQTYQIGLFALKNTFGFLAELGALTAAAQWFLKRSLSQKLLWSVGPFLFCFGCLLLTHSGTSLLTLLATLAIVGMVASVAALPRALRLPALIASCATLVLLINAGLAAGGEEWVLGQLGKDVTLTGRTYLWHEGRTIAQERPFLGHGYSAFWVQGQPQAERYWKEFFIANRSGFHFHNVWVQTAVDLGYAGTVLIFTLVASALLLSLRTVMRRGAEPEALFLFALIIMFMTRMFTEIDFFNGPFGMGTWLFYAIIPRLMPPRASSSATVPPSEASAP